MLVLTIHYKRRSKTACDFFEGGGEVFHAGSVQSVGGAQGIRHVDAGLDYVYGDDLFTVGDDSGLGL